MVTFYVILTAFEQLDRWVVMVAVVLPLLVGHKPFIRDCAVHYAFLISFSSSFSVPSVQSLKPRLSFVFISLFLSQHPLILEFCLEISSGSFCVWLCPSLLTCHLRKETFLRTLASEHFFSFLPNTYHDLKLYVYFLLVSVTISLVIAANTALSPCAK